METGTLMGLRRGRASERAAGRHYFWHIVTGY